MTAGARQRMDCDWSFDRGLGTGDLGNRGAGAPAAVPGDRPAPPRPGPSRTDQQRNQRLLVTRTVEMEVVPRLVLARRAAPPPSPPPSPPPVPKLSAVPKLSIEEFTGLVLGTNLTGPIAYADRARNGGISVETLYLDLLAPTARHLGDLWNEDLVDFTQVTVGLGRLHQVLREISPAFQNAVPQETYRRPTQDRRALLVAAPGEQHSFGLAMVAEFFRRSAWVVWSGAPASGAELLAIVRDNWFGVVGFSLGYEGRLDALRAGIRDVRRASRNRRVGIMVGGPVFIEHPELVAGVGADATAIDGGQAVKQAQRVLTLLRTLD